MKEKGILGPGQMGQCTRDLASLRMHHNVNQGTAKLGWDSSGNSQQLQQRSNLLGDHGNTCGSGSDSSNSILAPMPNLFSLNTNIVNIFKGMPTPQILTFVSVLRRLLLVASSPS